MPRDEIAEIKGRFFSRQADVSKAIMASAGYEDFEKKTEDGFTVEDTLEGYVVQQVQGAVDRKS